MKLRTEIQLNKESYLINYDSNLVLFGSCFAENISTKLAYYRFNYLLNPYGILFHPLAIENALSEILNKKIYTQEDLYFHNDLWQSFSHHSKFTSENTNVILQTINNANSIAFESLKKATHVVISLGTAWVYDFLDTNKTVANCHKISQKKFNKRLLTSNDIEQSLQNIIALISQFNPEIQLIFTVSPVRHLSNGIAENSHSKALLLTAIHKIITSKNCYYFPSFEIMMDDLRDYRFYKDDLIHPNELAVNYIWEKFKKCWIDDKLLPVMDEVGAIQKGLMHRPFNENTEKHQQFLKNLNQKKAELALKYGIQF